MKLLTTSAAARLLNMTTDNGGTTNARAICWAASERGSGEGMRLFVQEDVERFQRQRNLTTRTLRQA